MSKQQDENERRLGELEEDKSGRTVRRLAQAIALVNGHSEPADWAAKVVDAWNTLASDTPVDTRSDLKQSIRDAREET